MRVHRLSACSPEQVEQLVLNESVRALEIKDLKMASVGSSHGVLNRHASQWAKKPGERTMRDLGRAKNPTA